MSVIKRNNSREDINIDKIKSKIQYFTNFIYPLKNVNVEFMTNQVSQGLHDGVSTSDIDVYTARKCMELETTEFEYGILASRILINNHHKNTLTSFKDKMETLYRRKDHNGKSHPFLNKTFYKFVCTNQRFIEGTIDYTRDYLLDTFGFCTLEKQYINKIDGKFVERPQDLFMREAITLCMNPDDFTDLKALEEIALIYDLLSTQKFTYATPTLNNSGLLTQQLSSCFLLGTTDSLEGINKTLNDAAKISKYGGGIGIHVSNIRSAGQLIRGTNGQSSGIVNFLRMYGACADAYNQGGKRKGSFAIFLRDYHPDFMEFIQLKNPIGDESQRARSLFFCAALSDMFWKAVEKDEMWHFVDPEEYYDGDLDEKYGDEFESIMKDLISRKKFKKSLKARDILKEIMKQQFESGVPYIINFDTINRKNNLSNYSTVKSSNLCVSGDTEILTNIGHISIKDIVEQDMKVQVWNGNEFKNATFAKTGINKKLIQIEMNNGEFVKCTPYHKFFIFNKNAKNQEIQVNAENLTVGSKLIKSKFPVIEMEGEWKYSYAHGFFCGDGTYLRGDNIPDKCDAKPMHNSAYCMYHNFQGDLPLGNYDICQGTYSPTNPAVYLYGEKKALLPHFPVRSVKCKLTENEQRITIPLPLDMPHKFAVPENTSIKTRLEWLSGYADADGSISRNGNNESLQICSINLNFLRRIKRMCQTLGVDPMISLMYNSRKTLLPDGKGGSKLYNCQISYRLLFNSTDTYSLYQMGLKTYRLKYNFNLPNRDARHFVTIKSITSLDEREDTYCFNEPDTHRGIFNGIIAGNCNEITLPSSSTEYGVCNLASLVLSSYVTDSPSDGDIEKLRIPKYERKPLENPVFDFKGLSKVVQVLTRTMDRVIDRTAYPVKEAMLSNILHRPVGIGSSGLADTCCLLRIPYDSNEGVKLSAYIAETIAFSSMSESSRLAKEKKTTSVAEQHQISQKIFEIYEESKKYHELTLKLQTLSQNTEINTEEYKSLILERQQYPENPCIDILPLAKKLGVYPSYYYGEGAPISKGLFQWKMWGLTHDNLSGMWDWETLEHHISKFGIRNSLLTAQMPTATTAQIMSVNEGVEPFTTNLYRRAILSGEFVVFNKYLIRDLMSIGVWNENMKNYLISSGGSIQEIEGIPEELKLLYRTAWDMGQKIGVRHAVARGPFIDHSQSFNVFIGNSTDENVRADKLYKTLYYGWKQGLKTGIYYLRTQPAIQAQKFSVPLENIVSGDIKSFNTRSIETHEEQGCLLCGT